MKMYQILVHGKLNSTRLCDCLEDVEDENKRYKYSVFFFDKMNHLKADKRILVNLLNDENSLLEVGYLSKIT